MRMHGIIVTGALALAAMMATSLPAAAQSRPAASVWNDSYQRGETNRLIALQEAESQERARANGYGPGQNTTNVYGDVNSWTTNNGPVMSSTAYNSVNSNVVDVRNGSGTVTVETDQTSGTADQSANAGTFVGRATTYASCTSARVC